MQTKNSLNHCQIENLSAYASPLIELEIRLWLFSQKIDQKNKKQNCDSTTEFKHTSKSAIRLLSVWLATIKYQNLDILCYGGSEIPCPS